MRANLFTVLVLGCAVLLAPAVQAAEKSEGEEHAAELRAQAAAMMREARELKQAGNEAQAREIMQKAERLMREAKEAAGPRESAELRERLDAMKKRIIELRREGQVDEAERLEKEAREFMQRAAQKDRPAEGPPREEVERRMHHLRVAAENLHAAGLHDQAEQVMRQAERLATMPQPRRPEGEREAPMRELIENMKSLNQRVERLEQAMRKMMESR